ncbi:hypothetical protein [Lacrimispora saccharolytica]|uniref:Oxaloacetate decarboxylase n=1 Tax=Lacrimispora saccharolytica (strain ATCC 35040 / DSM 2544 / NRCC 2533 / WM1) TaxID=610130 RepID=D9R7P3_LACSW|nr:hypothetical protein [Lacrimispora saccharolytica]ADL03772.1 hypothetical protein Closa_1164 [[Clostridium] saccharolyticum WM1]QRV18099.1 oxaloacetate decarboxylase [Lacrimispora saccharolytica]
MKKWICVITGIVGVVLTIAGTWLKKNGAVTMIGGAEGSTSMFIAGKINPIAPWVLILIGIIILAGGIIIFVNQDK